MDEEEDEDDTTDGSRTMASKMSKFGKISSPLVLRRGDSSSVVNESITRPSVVEEYLDFKKTSFDGISIFVNQVTFSVHDGSSPLSKRKVLEDVSAKFSGGKLTAVMGAKDSGKSSLLYLLGGGGHGLFKKEYTGTISYNGVEFDSSRKRWQLAAYVEAYEYHFLDLSVSEILYYAAILRCVKKDDLKLVDQNVKTVIDLLALQRLILFLIIFKYRHS